MPIAEDIVRDSINELSRIQDWMELAKENNDMVTYNAIHKRYIELKVILNSISGFDISMLTDIDKIKE